MLFDEIMSGYGSSVTVADEACSFELDGDVNALTEFSLDILRIRRMENEAEKEALTEYASAMNGYIAMESVDSRLRVIREGFFSDLIESIKNAIKKLWAKIKGWFKSLKNWVIDLFRSNQKWFDENSDVIDKRKGNKIWVDTYEYDTQALMKAGNTITKGYKELKTMFDEIEKAGNDDELKRYDDAHIHDGVCSALGVAVRGKDSVSEAIKKLCRGRHGTKAKRQVTVGEIKQKYDDIKDYQKTINDNEHAMEDTFAEATKTADAALKTAEEAAAKAEKGTNNDAERKKSKFAKDRANRVVAALRVGIKDLQDANSAVSSVWSETMKFCLATIRRGASVRGKDEPKD